MKKVLVLMVMLALVSTASARVISLSLDGTNALANGYNLTAAPGSSTDIYVISDVGGDDVYWTYLEMNKTLAGGLSAPGAIVKYAAAGNIAAVTDYSTGIFYDVELGAFDTTVGDNVPAAGSHFKFVLSISPTAKTDGTDDFSFWITKPNDATYPAWRTINVKIPEPMTIVLLGLGSLFGLRRRK